MPLYNFQLFFFYCSGDHRDLHSFPTRRSSDLAQSQCEGRRRPRRAARRRAQTARAGDAIAPTTSERAGQDRKSTRLNSSHTVISYAVFCLKKKKKKKKKNKKHQKKSQQ